MQFNVFSLDTIAQRETLKKARGRAEGENDERRIGRIKCNVHLSLASPSSSSSSARTVKTKRSSLRDGNELNLRDRRSSVSSRSRIDGRGGRTRALICGALSCGEGPVSDSRRWREGRTNPARNESLVDRGLVSTDSTTNTETLRLTSIPVTSLGNGTSYGPASSTSGGRRR